MNLQFFTVRGRSALRLSGGDCVVGGAQSKRVARHLASSSTCTLDSDTASPSAPDYVPLSESSPADFVAGGGEETAADGPAFVFEGCTLCPYRCCSVIDTGSRC